jgi:hypothetical protein
MTRRIDLTFQYPKESWDAFLGEKLTDAHYDKLLTEDADVYTPEGELLLKFRRGILPVGATARAFEVLRRINTKTLNRGLASGKLATGHMYEKADGSISNTRAVPPEFAVISNVIGFYDRYVRTPFCRETAFNANHPEKYAACLPFLQAVSEVYRQEAGDRWALQKAVCDRTQPDWVIPKTVFTTITVNKNFQTAVHTDEGDFKEGLSCITAIRGGKFKGGVLVFPHYRVAVDLKTCDLLMFNSHHMHGNTAIVGRLNEYERVSLVLYYRENMQKCLSALDEQERAKHRKPGDPLW